jgi:hypothetical protein
MKAKAEKPRTDLPPHQIALALKRQEQVEAVRAVHLEMFDEYIRGERFYDLAKQYLPEISLTRLRYIIETDPEINEAWMSAGIERSHYLIEETLRNAKLAAAVGDAAGYRVAIDTHFKMAAKLNSKYDDKSKVELTGANGKPLELKADITLTSEQAYDRLIKGD